MTDFDPKKHKIVAVVTDKDDPDFGQHFHLSLPELVREVREIETQILPPEIVDRITALEAREPSREIITTIEQPVPAEIVKQWKRFKESQEYVLPHAFKELMERVSTLEHEPRNITPAVPKVVETVITRIEALEDRSDAGADMYETMALALRAVADLSKQIESNRARSDGQHGMVVDELSHLAGVIRMAG